MWRARSSGSGRRTPTTTGASAALASVYISCAGLSSDKTGGSSYVPAIPEVPSQRCDYPGAISAGRRSVRGRHSPMPMSAAERAWCLVVPHHPAGAGQARHRLAAEFASMIRPELLGNAVAVLAELVGNAVRHG